MRVRMCVHVCACVCMCVHVYACVGTAYAWVCAVRLEVGRVRAESVQSVLSLQMDACVQSVLSLDACVQSVLSLQMS